MLCTHCKKTNHTVENYYFKFGIPPGYRTKEQASTMTISNVPAATQKLATPQSGNSAEQSFHVSREEYNHLMHLLQSNKKDMGTTSTNNIDPSLHMVSSLSQQGNTGNSNFFWILDSWASDHVCPHIKYFSSISIIKPISVKFPNGSTVLAFYSGSIHFSDKLYLDNVLYIPQFQFNLISVYQLTNSLKCKVVFSHGFCAIQDHHT